MHEYTHIHGKKLYEKYCVRTSKMHIKIIPSLEMETIVCMFQLTELHLTKLIQEN